MKKILLLSIALFAFGSIASADNRETTTPANRYELAERFTASKLQNMLFSTTIDPHYFKSGEKFWYSYKTSTGSRLHVAGSTTYHFVPVLVL